jgi:hypothetical protein
LFEGIKKRWAEARADVAWKEIQDILLRYDRMDTNSRHFVSSAFDAVLSDVEENLGSLSEWSIEQKKECAKQLMISSRAAFATRGDSVHAVTTRLGAHGGALLSLYIECQTLPGSKAKAAVGAVYNWIEKAGTN